MDPVTVEQAYRCEQCQIEGRVVVLSTTDAGVVQELARADHSAKHPECYFPRLRFTQKWARYSSTV